MRTYILIGNQIGLAISKILKYIQIDILLLFYKDVLLNLIFEGVYVDFGSPQELFHYYPPWKIIIIIF